MGPVMEPETGATYCPFHPGVECEECEEMRILIRQEQYEDGLIDLSLEVNDEQYLY